MGVYVAVRTPSKGSLVGDLVERHPGSRVTSVPCGPAKAGRIDHLALVEGIPRSAVAQLLLAWNLRYGVPAEVIGDPFALRLPVILAAALPPWSGILTASDDLAVAGAVVEDGTVEQWVLCKDGAHARILARLRNAVTGHSAAEIVEGEPRTRDLECWDVLREAVALEAAYTRSDASFDVASSESPTAA